MRLLALFPSVDGDLLWPKLGVFSWSRAKSFLYYLLYQGRWCLSPLNNRILPPLSNGQIRGNGNWSTFFIRFYCRPLSYSFMPSGNVQSNINCLAADTPFQFCDENEFLHSTDFYAKRSNSLSSIGLQRDYWARSKSSIAFPTLYLVPFFPHKAPFYCYGWEATLFPPWAELANVETDVFAKPSSDQDGKRRESVCAWAQRTFPRFVRSAFYPRFLLSVCHQSCFSLPSYAGSRVVSEICCGCSGLQIPMSCFIGARRQKPF